MNKSTPIRWLALIALFLSSVCIYGQEFEYGTEKDLAIKVLEFLQKGDVEAFSTLCIDEDRMTAMLNGMTENTPMEASIKEELVSEADPLYLREETLNNFQSALERIETEGFTIQDSVYPEDPFYQTRFDVTNCRCIKLKADISSNKESMIILYMFHTDDDIFIYDFAMNPEVNY